MRHFTFGFRWFYFTSRSNYAVAQEKWKEALDEGEYQGR
jgi:hypothetical protein